jgi:hypothetical protein
VGSDVGGFVTGANVGDEVMGAAVVGDAASKRQTS